MSNKVLVIGAVGIGVFFLLHKTKDNPLKELVDNIISKGIPALSNVVNKGAVKVIDFAEDVSGDAADFAKSAGGSVVHGGNSAIHYIGGLF